MARIVQMVRMTTSQLGEYTGPAGQIVVNTDTWQVSIHDGVTPGGHSSLVASNNLSDLPSPTLARDALGLGTAAIEDSSAFDPAGAAAAVAASVTALDAATMKKAQNLNDVADKAAARVNLDLEIGVDILAYSAVLASLAAAGGTADTFPYLSASNTYSLASITAAGRALLDDANAAAQRTTLGIGNITNIGIYVQSGDPGGVGDNQLWAW